MDTEINWPAVRANMAAAEDERIPEDELIAEMRYVANDAETMLLTLTCYHFSTFMVAAHDTTSSGLARCLHTLATRADAQERLRKMKKNTTTH